MASKPPSPDDPIAAPEDDPNQSELDRKLAAGAGNRVVGGKPVPSSPLDDEAGDDEDDEDELDLDDDEDDGRDRRNDRAGPAAETIE